MDFSGIESCKIMTENPSTSTNLYTSQSAAWSVGLIEFVGHDV